MSETKDGYTLTIIDNFDDSMCSLHCEQPGISVVEAMVRCMEAMTFSRGCIKRCMEEVLEDM